MSKTIIRWAGSKKKLLPILLDKRPAEFNKYIEPFAGSACLFFELKPDKAIVNDINKELINSYKCITENASIIGKILNKIPKDKELYYKIREYDKNKLSSIERTIRFLYLNRNCFNAVYRTNQKGEFNVPFGTRTGKPPTTEEFINAGELLSKAKLFSKDFTQLKDEIEAKDFIYLDPPYSSNDNKDLYGPNSFKEKNLTELLNFVYEADKKGAFVLISYKNKKEFVKEFEEWNVEMLEVKRHIAGFAKKRKNAKEVLISNF